MPVSSSANTNFKRRNTIQVHPTFPSPTSPSHNPMPAHIQAVPSFRCYGILFNIFKRWFLDCILTSFGVDSPLFIDSKGFPNSLCALLLLSCHTWHLLISDHTGHLSVFALVCLIIWFLLLSRTLALCHVSTCLIIVCLPFALIVSNILLLYAIHVYVYVLTSRKTTESTGYLCRPIIADSLLCDLSANILLCPNDTRIFLICFLYELSSW